MDAKSTPQAPERASGPQKYAFWCKWIPNPSPRARPWEAPGHQKRPKWVHFAHFGRNGRQIHPQGPKWASGTPKWPKWPNRADQNFKNGHYFSRNNAFSSASYFRRNASHGRPFVLRGPRPVFGQRGKKGHISRRIRTFKNAMWRIFPQNWLIQHFLGLFEVEFHRMHEEKCLLLAKKKAIAYMLKSGRCSKYCWESGRSLTSWRTMKHLVRFHSYFRSETLSKHGERFY